MDLPNDEPGEHPYVLHTIDPRTGRRPTLKAISYVDDNAVYTTAKTAKRLLQRA